MSLEPPKPGEGIACAEWFNGKLRKGLILELELRPDIEQVMANWDRFWTQRGLDRPMIMCRTPRGEPMPHPPAGDMVDGDIDACIEASLAWLRSFHWMGDAIPACMPQLGPDHFAALLGSRLEVHPDSRTTVWMHPCVSDWDDFEIRVRWEDRWWERTVALLERYRERCAGICLVSPPNLQGGLDCLAALRGVEPLAMDLVMEPEKVKRALNAVNQCFMQVKQRLAEICEVERYGSVNRHLFYHRDQVGIPQCDFSCLIGPEDFREFGLPAIRFEAAQFAESEYHLDGPNAIRHLEAIAGVPDISVIQWQPGFKDMERDWTDLYRRIDALGKGAYLFAGPEMLRRRWRENRNRMLCCELKVADRREALTVFDAYSMA